MEINFVGGGYAGRSLDLNAQVCQNWYPVIDQQDGASILSLAMTPGLTLWKDFGDADESRGSILWDGALFWVIGNTLYKCTTGGTVTDVGTIGTATGRVYLAGGLTHLMVVDGVKGYYQASGAGALTEIVDVDFPVPTSCIYLDSFFLVSESGTDDIFMSAEEYASSWDGIDFSAAKEQPDDVTLIHAYRRHMMAYGTDTIEVFYNTGDVDFPWTRVAGAALSIGLGAAASVASGSEGMFFLDSNLQIRTWQGYNTQVISTPQIDYVISGYATTSDAVGYVYTQEGHSFYMISFPTVNKTWCFDITTGFWHRRSSGLAGGRHLSDWHQRFAGKNLVGAPATGLVYELDLAAYTDNTATIKSIRSAQVVQAGRQEVFHNRLELHFEAGVGLSTGLGTGTAVLAADAVTSVTIDDGGSGYTTAPKVQFSGGGGSGAVATTALSSGVIDSVTIVAGGSGYTSAPTVAFVGGTQDPQAMLDWSDDGGHVWSNEHWASIGRIGEYTSRALWRRLGRSRNRIYRLSITDPVKRVIIGAHLESEVGSS